MAGLCFGQATMTSWGLDSMRGNREALSVYKAVLIEFGVVVEFLVVEALFQMTKELCSLSLSCCSNNKFSNFGQSIVCGKAGSNTSQITKHEDHGIDYNVTITDQGNNAE